MSEKPFSSAPSVSGFDTKKDNKERASRATFAHSCTATSVFCQGGGHHFGGRDVCLWQACWPLEFAHSIDVLAACCEDRHLALPCFSCSLPRPVTDEPLGVDSQSVFVRLKRARPFPTVLTMTNRSNERDPFLDLTVKEAVTGRNRHAVVADKALRSPLSSSSSHGSAKVVANSETAIGKVPKLQWLFSDTTASKAAEVIDDFLTKVVCGETSASRS